VARVVTSGSNPRLRLVRRLESSQQRKRLGLFACEGEDLVEAALDAGLVPVEALVDAKRPALADRLAEATIVDAPLMASLSTLSHPPRVIGVFRRADLPSGTDAPVGLALWRVHDPGNLGTLIRAADALGPAFVAVSDGCADPTGPKALRAAMGATFRVPLAGWDDVSGPRIALVADAPTPLWEAELPERATFVLGAERDGLPPDLVADCDLAVSVPLSGEAESLNVAMAGTVALYEWRRRRA
jgi:RNA methyltransferase, TrmH family